MPTPVVPPTIDTATAEKIAQALADAERPVIYAGGGVQARTRRRNWRH